MTSSPIKRFGALVFAISLAMIPVSAVASDRKATVVAELEEESVPAADLTPEPAAGAPASPAAAPSQSSGAVSPDSSAPDSGDDWEAVQPEQAPPAEEAQPQSNNSAPAEPAAAATATADIAPALDIGSITTTPQISDSSLTPLIESAPTPARAASLRITEQERVELEQGHDDSAIRGLAHAISIDPSNSYAYLYLGRAYIARAKYSQAQTFLKRAEIGLGGNPAWLGEIYAFEGLCAEESGKPAEAAILYQKALAASPGNLTARVGATRVASSNEPAGGPAPATALDAPAPAEPEIAPPPTEAPPPPPPASPPPSD